MSRLVGATLRAHGASKCDDFAAQRSYSLALAEISTTLHHGLGAAHIFAARYTSGLGHAVTDQMTGADMA